MEFEIVETPIRFHLHGLSSNVQNNSYDYCQTHRLQLRRLRNDGRSKYFGHLSGWSELSSAIFFGTFRHGASRGESSGTAQAVWRCKDSLSLTREGPEGLRPSAICVR